MKWFLPFLGLVFFGEILATYFYTVSNIKIYYIISIVELAFYSYIFYHLHHRKSIKKIIFFLFVICEIGYIISFVFFGKNYTYFFNNLIVSGFYLVTIALIYLYIKVIDFDNASLTSEPGFWIATGVSLFFSGVSISFSLYEFIKSNSLYLFGEKLYNIIPQILSIVLYLCISIALILCRQKNKILF